MLKLNDLAHDVNTFVGGKRGLSVIASAVVTGLVYAGKITPQTAAAVGVVAGAVGLVGVGHNIIRNGNAPDPTPPVK